MFCNVSLFLMAVIIALTQASDGPERDDGFYRQPFRGFGRPIFKQPRPFGENFFNPFNQFSQGFPGGAGGFLGGRPGFPGGAGGFLGRRPGFPGGAGSFLGGRPGLGGNPFFGGNQFNQNGFYGRGWGGGDTRRK